MAYGPAWKELDRTTRGDTLAAYMDMVVLVSGGAPEGGSALVLAEFSGAGELWVALAGAVLGGCCQG
jgi:hypothetical protein